MKNFFVFWSCIVFHPALWLPAQAAPRRAPAVRRVRTRPPSKPRPTPTPVTGPEWRNYNNIRMEPPVFAPAPWAEVRLPEVTNVADGLTLAYASSYARQYIMVRRFGSEPSEYPPVVTYQLHIAPIYLIAGPEFSPSGRYIAFKSGDLFDKRAGYRFYIIDRRTHTLIGGPDGVTYENVFWSPDSRFVAYLSGEELGVFKVQNRQTRVLARGVDMQQICWTQQGTLLYTSRSTPPGVTNPSIYEVSVDGHAPPQLLIESGESPLASPDGKQVAFFVSPDLLPKRDQTPDVLARQKQENNLDSGYYAPRLPMLHIFDRATRTRRRVEPDLVRGYGGVNDPLLQWQPDGRTLVVLEQKIKRQGEAFTTQAELRALNIPDGTWQSLATMVLPEDTSKPVAIPPDYFSVKAFAHREQFWVWGNEARKPSSGPTYIYDTTQVCFAVSWKGGVQRLARLWGIIGFDWFETSHSQLGINGETETSQTKPK